MPSTCLPTSVLAHKILPRGLCSCARAFQFFSGSVFVCLLAVSCLVCFYDLSLCRSHSYTAHVAQCFLCLVVPLPYIHTRTICFRFVVAHAHTSPQCVSKHHSSIFWIPQMSCARLKTIRSDVAISLSVSMYIPLTLSLYIYVYIHSYLEPLGQAL